MSSSSKSWQRVTELFAQTLEQSPEKRVEFLELACADDADLLREVQSLLAEHEAEEAFLELPAIAAVADQIVHHNGELRAGQQLGQYRIETLLGAGGMGKVYIARDRLGRRIALKLLTQRFPGDKSSIARFQQEARMLLALNHPHIVTIHDIDESEGIYYIASELVEGDTLRRKLDKGDLNLESVLDIAIQVTTALAAAHEKGIVHRDIKPENIMIRRDGFVKVLDFGVAKLSEKFSAPEPEAPTLKQFHTAEGTVVGTAPYMSPEQARGLVVDARTDIWSLGVVIYEAVTGRKPFSGDTTADVISSVIEKTPAPLSRYTSNLPEALEWIVSRALRKTQSDRYQTASELLTDLKELRTRMEIAKVSGEVGSPAAVSPPSPVRATKENTAPAAPTYVSTIEYITTGIKRHKAVFAVAILILTAGLVWLAFYLKKSRTEVASPAAIQSLAVLPFKNESGNSDDDYLTDGMTDTLIISLSRLPNMIVKSRFSVARYQDKEIDLAQVASQLSVQAVLSGRLKQHGDQLTLYLSLVDARTGNQIWGQQYDRSTKDIATLQSDIAHDVSQRLRPLTAAERQTLAKGGTGNTEAYRAYLKGLYYWQKSRGSGYDKSREYFQQAIDLDPGFALGYTGLAHYYGFATARGMLPPDAENWRRSEAAVNKALELDDTLAETYNARVGIELYFHRDWVAAEQSFRRGLELNPNSAEVNHHYALCLVLFGRNEEAVAEMKRTLDIEPLSLRYNLNYATLLFWLHQYDRAIEQLQKTLDLDPNFGPAYEWLGNVYEQKGMQKEAIQAWITALTLRRQTELAANVERAYSAQGFDAAVRILEQAALKDAEERLKRGEYVTPTEYVLAYERLGDKDKALAWVEKAVEAHDRFSVQLLIDPLYDKLRSDPRFQAALRRIVIRQ
jgi:serine/threonine protein kinase/Flp pilus assembly protein TadD